MESSGIQYLSSICLMSKFTSPTLVIAKHWIASKSFIKPSPKISVLTCKFLPYCKVNNIKLNQDWQGSIQEISRLILCYQLALYSVFIVNGYHIPWKQPLNLIKIPILCTCVKTKRLLLIHIQGATGLHTSTP